MTDVILTEVNGRVATVTINRPEQLNALNQEVMEQVVEAVQKFDRDPGIGAIVITGAGRAFAAGADIKEMASQTHPDTTVTNMYADWDRIRQIRTPIITAVNGYALGGGCEVAMLGHMILASENAQFGQPEITLGVIPGMGGTQRLTRAVGRAVAMDMVLTGRKLKADEALQAGLVSRVLPAEGFMDSVAEIAAKVADMPLGAAMAATESVDRAWEVGLAEGLLFERRVFQGLFGTPDQEEGMAAFVEKRPAQWNR